jgi:hypothetical protein
MASKSRVAKTATEGVKILWEEKFFRTWQKMSAVEAALAKRENHFPPAALDMALKRASYLTRRGKPKKYEYIQQYPYVAESSDVPTVDKKGKK